MNIDEVFKYQIVYLVLILIAAFGINLFIA